MAEDTEAELKNIGKDEWKFVLLARKLDAVAHDLKALTRRVEALEASDVPAEQVARKVVREVPYQWAAIGPWTFIRSEGA